jgi:hypothetical protein
MKDLQGYEKEVEAMEGEIALPKFDRTSLIAAPELVAF